MKTACTRLFDARQTHSSGMWTKFIKRDNQIFFHNSTVTTVIFYKHGIYIKCKRKILSVILLITWL